MFYGHKAKMTPITQETQKAHSARLVKLNQTPVV